MLGFGVLVRIAQVFGAFWRLFGPFLGHIVELKSTRDLFDTVKSSRTCSVPFSVGQNAAPRAQSGSKPLV